RKDIVKDISKRAEDAKVTIRATRRESIEKLKAMKKESVITEDDLKNGETKLQKITDKYTKLVDDVLASKEKEILEI
ncbi:MAG: ribosome-recycling factor, partial [Oscillospiraceae bacterium]